MAVWLVETRQRGCTRRRQQPRILADDCRYRPSLAGKDRLVGVAVDQALELGLQRPSIDRFEETEPEAIVDLEKRANDLACEALILEESIRVCPVRRDKPAWSCE